MIYKEIGQNEFANELSENKTNGFSYDGACILFDYLEGFGEDIELDVVALRCEFNEYTKEEYIKEFCQEEWNEYYEENKREDEGEDIIQAEFLEEFLEEYIGFEDDVIVVRA